MTDGRPATPLEREMAAEADAEYREQVRRGYWDPPAEFDDAGPTGHGWTPDPYPDGSLI